MIFARTLLAIVLLGATACQFEGDLAGPVSGADRARELLLNELDQRIADRGSIIPLDSSELRVDCVESNAVPDLRYFFGVYPPAEYRHVSFSRMVAQRGDTIRLIHDAVDWSAVIGSWRPSTSSAVLDACEEVLLAERGLHPNQVTVIRSSDFSVPAPFADGIPEIEDAVTVPDVIRVSNGSWRAHFWTMLPTAMRLKVLRFTCDLPLSGHAHLSATDSITTP